MKHELSYKCKTTNIQENKTGEKSSDSREKQFLDLKTKAIKINY